MDISALNYVDYTILSVLAASGLLAMLRGFMRELLGALGWVVAVIVARLSKAWPAINCKITSMMKP